MRRSSTVYKQKQSKTVMNLSADFDLRGQQELFTGGNIMDSYFDKE